MAASTVQAERHGLHIERSIEIQGPLHALWDALLEEIGPRMSNEQNQPLHMKLEPWPGGRLYRDLGNNTGHLWGHVQVIKPPTLLEITGPLFMSYAAVNHLQYRLTENARGNGARLTLIHRAFGDIDPAHWDGVAEGWSELLANVRKAAERR